MFNIKPNLVTVLFVFSCVAMSACGGGGDSSVTPGPSAAASEPGTPPQASVSASMWTMDSYTYANGGFSAHSTTDAGERSRTTVVVSTATLAGGDTQNGAYSGGALTFTFYGSAAGTYNVVSSMAELVASQPADSPILVQSNVGIATTTGATLYTAASGQIVVTLDDAGKYHFSSVDPLPAGKTLEVLGGVVGAPASMELTIHDAY